MKVEPRSPQIDWLFLGFLAAIVAAGISTVHSATWKPGGDGTSAIALRQGLWTTVGVVVMLFVAAVDPRRIERSAYAVYGVVLGLLILVPVVGFIGGGSRRWIDVGFFALQPSELMKIALVLAVARYLQADEPLAGLRFRDLGVPFLLFGAPAVLILVQPDLGTTVLLGLVFASVLLMAGLRLRSVGLAVSVAGFAAFWAGELVWSQLKPYQQRRILTFLDPEADPLGAGYHVIQSKIAVGSGMVWGKGYLEGTQNQLRFLPEQHTDFIFSVFAEEWGVVGCLLLLTLYAGLILRGLQIASRSNDRFGAIVAFGILATIFWQMAINVAMAVGLMPVVGITLPFFSYGGSSMVTLFLGVGLVLNVSVRRFLFLKPGRR